MEQLSGLTFHCLAAAVINNARAVARAITLGLLRWTRVRAEGAEDAAVAGLGTKRVEDFPDDEVLAEFEATSEFELLGLFRGRGLAQSEGAQTGQPDLLGGLLDGAGQLGVALLLVSAEFLQFFDHKASVVRLVGVAGATLPSTHGSTVRRTVRKV